MHVRSLTKQTKPLLLFIPKKQRKTKLLSLRYVAGGKRPNFLKGKLFFALEALLAVGIFDVFYWFMTK